MEGIYDSVLAAGDVLQAFNESTKRLALVAPIHEEATCRAVFAGALQGCTYLERAFALEDDLFNIRAADVKRNKTVARIKDRAKTPRKLTKDEIFDIIVSRYCPESVSAECWVPNAMWYHSQLRMVMPEPSKEARRHYNSSVELFALGTRKPVKIKSRVSSN
jgi:hypothetical protein